MGRAGQAGRPTRADEHWTTLDVVHWNDEPGVRLFGTELEWRVTREGFSWKFARLLCSGFTRGGVTRQGRDLGGGWCVGVALGGFGFGVVRRHGVLGSCCLLGWIDGRMIAWGSWMKRLVS
jgi:hypothetical protein